MLSCRELVLSGCRIDTVNLDWLVAFNECVVTGRVPFLFSTRFIKLSLG